MVPVPPSPDAMPVPSGMGGAVVPSFDMGMDDDEGKVDSGAKIRRYIAAVKRFRWLILVLVILGGGAGAFMSRFVKPTYDAYGTIWIADVMPGGGNNNVRGPELFPTGSWIELFRSFSVIDRVVTKKHLWYTPKTARDTLALFGVLYPTAGSVSGDYTLTLDPAGTHYTLSEAKRGVVERGTVGDTIGRSVGFIWTPSPDVLRRLRTVGVWVAQPRVVATGLATGVEISMQEQSNLLKVGLTGQDRLKTADLLNVWMAAFVDRVAELRRQNGTEVEGLVASQKAAAERQLADAESRLETFQVGAVTQPGQSATPSTAIATGGTSGDALAATYFRNQAGYDSVRHDRIALENIAAAGRDGTLAPDEVASIPSVMQAPELLATLKDLIDKESQLRTLRQSYTDQYKPVRDMAATVQTLRTQTIPQLALDAAHALRTRENDLATSLTRDSLRLRGIPERTMKEAQLRRDLQIAEGQYTDIQKKYEASRLATVTEVPDVSILDPALPSLSPQRNMKVLLTLGGFMGAFGFGVALALLFDMIDPRFRYPEQITDELKLEVIGAVPAVPKAGDAMNDPEAMLHSIEAFRGLRMRLHHSFETPPVMLTITSPGAGDGKSMIASNLALSFAEAGYRTLLIDGDIRRGKLHSVFNIDRRPGLLDYLAGEADIQDIMREVSPNGRFTVIPSGTRRHRGPELLTSARLPALINTMRTRFDVILIDSAPLGAGIDGFALGVATRNMILVMRTGVTDRRVAKAKLKLLSSFPVRMIGAVVNDVPAAGLYQEYSYLYGYAADIDPETAQQGEIPVLHPGDATTT